MLSQIISSRWIRRLYKRPHKSVCALIHQVVVFGSCRPAQESTRVFLGFFVLFFSCSYSKTDILCVFSFSLALNQVQTGDFESCVLFVFTVQTKKKSSIVSFGLMQAVQESVERQRTWVRLITASRYVAKQNVEQSSCREPFPRCTEVCQ